MIILEEIVCDSFGNKINLWKLKTDNNNPNIFLVGRFHGDEPEGEYILEKLVNKLKKQ